MFQASRNAETDGSVFDTEMNKDKTDSVFVAEMNKDTTHSVLIADMSKDTDRVTIDRNGKFRDASSAVEKDKNKLKVEESSNKRPGKKVSMKTYDSHRL